METATQPTHTCSECGSPIPLIASVCDNCSSFAPQETPAQQEPKFDRSGLKEACQRALALGRTHQTTDIQLFLDMLLEIERYEHRDPAFQKLVEAVSAEHTHLSNAVRAHRRDSHDDDQETFFDCAVCGMLDNRLNRLRKALLLAGETR